jgi:hypothetical protein
VADWIELMTKAFSQNGYLANDETLIKTWDIPGTTRRIRLHEGAPGALLVHFLAWFHANIEPLDTGILDDWGFAVRPIRGEEVEFDDDGNAINLSNHASGTAGDANATKHGLGQRGTFTKTQTAKIRAELGRPEYGGCIRWGGDYTKRADEMHFEIVKSIAACQAALSRLTTPPPQEGLTVADVDKILAYQKACTIQIQANFKQLLTNSTAAILKAVNATDADVDALNAELDLRDAQMLKAIDDIPGGPA